MFEMILSGAYMNITPFAGLSPKANWTKSVAGSDMELGQPMILLLTAVPCPVESSTKSVGALFARAPA